MRSAINHQHVIVKIATVAFCLLFSGCQSDKPRTLGELKYDSKKEREVQFEKRSYEEVRAEYRELVDLIEDKKLKEKIQRRISDVYMIENQVDNEDGNASQYTEAIKAYRSILEKYPNSPENAEVFYQLAKAYDLEGRQEDALKMLTELVARHPNYVNISEAYFRKADIHFNFSEYEKAKTSYLAAIDQSNDRIQLNAHYMLAWVHYKQLKYLSAIDSFSFVLTSILTEGENLDSLTKAEKPLVSDCVNSISLALDKVGGAEIIEEIESISKQSYVWMIYDNLGNYYLEKELYEESANTFRYFVNNNQNSIKAPYFHNRIINAYVKGSFPVEALKEKENYVSAYGLNSGYPTPSPEIEKEILGHLKVYLEELARYHYVEGQNFKTLQDKQKQAQSKNIATSNDRSDEIESFRKAADYYGQYIALFPKDDSVQKIRFLKAEAHFLAEDYIVAAEEYEIVAYDTGFKKKTEHASDAGYAAIISYQKYIEKVPPTDGGSHSPNVRHYQASAVESMVRFATNFDNDERSPAVLANAADYLFGLEQYDRAIEMVSGLLAGKKTLDKKLTKTAYEIKAHSHFKLGQFVEAKDSYLLHRQFFKKDSKEYQVISERISTSIFKQSEILEKEQGQMAAAENLLTIKTLAPNSKVRITAQYDAASIFMKANEWGKAIHELLELIERYPNTELAVQFHRKVALAYEKNENWLAAAKRYGALYANDPDATVKREALFQSAMLYEKSGDREQAITLYKSYAYEYEQPFDTRMEARYKLAINYEAIGDIGKSLYWLRRIIEGDINAGDQRSDRSQWLAAWANMRYGDYFYSEFENRKLYQPLVKFLPKKQEFFQKTSNSYQEGAKYAILEMVTESSFKLARLHEEFAEELRNLREPKGLDEASREDYRLIIEGQAQPLTELAIQLHQANITRAWEGEFTPWISKSFKAIRKLRPERFDKEELITTYGEGIR